MTTKDMIARAQVWAKRGTDEHERAHHMLDADADQYSDEARDAEEDGDKPGAERMRRDAEMYCAARDALDAVPMLVGEIDRLRVEKALILAHLRDKAKRCADNPEDRDTAADMLREAADEIEAGDHIEEVAT